MNVPTKYLTYFRYNNVVDVTTKWLSHTQFMCGRLNLFLIFMAWNIIYVELSTVLKTNILSST